MPKHIKKIEISINLFNTTPNNKIEITVTNKGPVPLAMDRLLSNLQFHMI